MSTSNKKMFDDFLLIITDRNLAILYTDEEMTELLNRYLSLGKNLYFRNCEADLSDTEAYDFYTQDFVGNNVQTEFVITQYPTDPNSDSITLVATVNAVATTDYTFDENTLTFTFDSAPGLGIAVVCGYEFIGQFNEDLTEEEQGILSFAMQLVWLEDKGADSDKLKERLTTKDFHQLHSPANLLDKLLKMRKDYNKDVRIKRNEYSYGDSFEGFN